MVEPSEWEWVAGQVEGDFDHLLIASSVTVFLTHGHHFLEVWNEAVADGAWGTHLIWLAELLRKGVNMDRWASFGESFEAITALL